MLRERQVAVVFVSHILEEVMALCDEVTVLRDGAVVIARVPRAELTVPAIVEAMLGERARPPRSSTGAADRASVDVAGGERCELRGRRRRGRAWSALR